MKASSSDCVTAGPVGLLGVQTMTTLVRSVTAAAIASRSWRPSAVQRHLDARRAAGGDGDRVGLEGAPGVDDLVAGLAERVDELVDQADRAGRRGEVLDRHAHRLAEGGVERGAAHVGVAVHLRRGLGRRLQHAGQRRVGVLVGRQLVGRQALARRRAACRRRTQGWRARWAGAGGGGHARDLSEPGDRATASGTGQQQHADDEADPGPEDVVDHVGDVAGAVEPGELELA